MLETEQSPLLTKSELSQPQVNTILKKNPFIPHISKYGLRTRCSLHALFLLPNMLVIILNWT